MNSTPMRLLTIFAASSLFCACSSNTEPDRLHGDPIDVGVGGWIGTGGGGGGGGGDSGGNGGGGVGASPGCGVAAKDADQSYVSIPVTSNGQTLTRQFWISYPPGYDPAVPSRLVVGLHGRDYSGDKMQEYLSLESPPVEPQNNEIFVYPDALNRDWGSWGNAIGWQLGPGAADTNAAGEEDLAFIDAMIEYVENNYCVDPSRIFVTGQSWGGDFSNVLACLRGDVFRAAVAVAANGIYYLESPPVACQGSAAVWAMHGKGDPYFAVPLGEEYRDFWVAQNKCSTSFDDLGITTQSGSAEECVEYQSCVERVRYCSYDESFGHQVPDDYYAQETMKFFRSF